MKKYNIILDEEKLSKILKCKYTCTSSETVDCAYCEDSWDYKYSEEIFKKSLKELGFKEI